MALDHLVIREEVKDHREDVRKRCKILQTIIKLIFYILRKEILCLGYFLDRGKM